MANGPASDVSTRRKGITHRGIILSILIFIMSLCLSLCLYPSLHPSQSLFIFCLFPEVPRTQRTKPSPPPTNTHSNNRCPRSACATVEMSSATFACILTGRDGVDARCLPDSLIHQLSPGRSQQNEEGEEGGREGKREYMGKIKRVKGES